MRTPFKSLFKRQKFCPLNLDRWFGLNRSKKIHAFGSRYASTRSVLTATLVVSVVVGSCSWPGRKKVSTYSPKVVSLGQPVPKGGGHYKVGNPYFINGRRYIPRVDRSYDRVGIASWYGTDFHGRRTANGEVYDMNALTAAHPTLPMPVYGRVTNLENGRTIVVRINDRGPYAHNRVIDLSRRSAELLGFKNKGTARVRVKYLGRAPLNGDDRYERRFLAHQPWAPGYRSQRYRFASVSPHQVTSVGSIPQTRPTSVTAGIQGPSLYQVEAGTFENWQRARKADVYLNIDEPRQIIATHVEGRKRFTMMFGPYLNRQQAELISQRIRRTGTGHVRIIEVK